MALSLGGGSKEETRLLWRLAGMGFQFGTEIIAGVLLGYLVDRFFGTAPWGVMIGAIAGILVAMSHFIRQAVRLNREMDRLARVPRSAGTPAAPIQPDEYDPDRLLELMESEFPEEGLTHDQWKALRDRDSEPQPKPVRREDSAQWPHQHGPEHER